MNETNRAFEEITAPTSETVAAPIGTGTSAFESAVTATVGDGIVGKIGKYRWMICALLFFATTINYIDRQVLGILATDEAFKAQIGWNEAEYGFVNTAFQAAYAIGLLVVGGLMDKFGTRKGFSFAIIFWSVAAMGHSLARSAFGFGIARFTLGLGEAGNFPAAIKTVAEWFPKKERALATGIFNSGTNIGAIVTPLTVPFIASHFGWRWAFIITGLLGFIWLVFWLALYLKPEEKKNLTPEEFAHINSDPPETETLIPWASLLIYPQTWAFAVGKFLTDPVWWFYLFWIPGFLFEKFNLSLTSLGLPLVIIYLSADIGSIGGGWLSSALMKRGWTINAARKTAMLICALCVVPIVFAAETTNVWIAVALLSLATAAHQGWSANLFTTTSDMFPRRAVGSVVGIGGMAGAIGGMFIAKAAGYILQWTGSYLYLFVIAGSTYLIALLLIQILAPKLNEANVERA